MAPIKVKSTLIGAICYLFGEGGIPAWQSDTREGRVDTRGAE